MKIYRVRTYVPGFDEILYGGIPERNVVLVSGGPGTGKSILAKQFLYNGLLKGEHGVFVALEEHPVSTRRSFAHFSWDITKYEKEGALAIVDAFTAGIGSSAQRENYVVKDPESVQELVDVLRAAIKNTGAKRVAIDSVSTLYLTKPALARGTVMILKRVIAGLGNTALFVSQISVGERGFGGPGVEHAVDGIVRIDLDEVEGRLYRSILVWKMRDSKISMVRHPMEINDEGIKVLWDKSLNISPTGAKINELPEDIKEEMKKAVEEAEKGVHEVQEEF